MPLTILIVEDIPITQQWMKQAALLAFANAKVVLANSLASALAVIETVQPNLTMVDLNLPDGTGDAFISNNVKTHPNCINIVITLYADEYHLMNSLTAGAKGYILKDQPKQKIADMLKQAISGELPLSPAMAKLVLQQFNPTIGKQQNPLSNREHQVLKLVSVGLNTPKIALELSISKYTVEGHLKKIFKKLHVKNRIEATNKAQKMGFI